MRRTVALCLLIASAGLMISAGDVRGKSPALGILILAHGHEKIWNNQIEEVARQLPFSAEVALGMAHRNSIQAALLRLQRRGVQKIAVVPLFVSSYSPIIRASAYLLGLAAERPPELEMFNNMSHGLQDPHRGLGDDAPELTPIRADVPVKMTSALDDHPLVAQILADRARSISRNPRHETVILVGHGPVSEIDNRRWLENMDRLAIRLRNECGFFEVQARTLMQDAPANLRDQAAATLRLNVRSAARRGDVLLVPLLLSRGGIEHQLKTILSGLRFRMPEKFLLPDARIARWIAEQAESADRQISLETK
ncbi:MAG TPA: CbiX/SirB N-terminal domain-containing protein [Acidobacteriota bacterium]|jgi:sirohydrochlorin ferrochelatase